MDIGPVLVGLGGLASLFTILDSLGFVPNGPHMLKRIKARIEARRKWHEEVVKLHWRQEATDIEMTTLKAQVATLKDQAADLPQLKSQVQELQQRVANLELSESKWVRGTFDRSPEAQRIKQAAKEHADRQSDAAGQPVQQEYTNLSAPPIPTYPQASRPLNTDGATWMPVRISETEEKIRRGF